MSEIILKNYNIRSYWKDNESMDYDINSVIHNKKFSSRLKIAFHHSQYWHYSITLFAMSASYNQLNIHYRLIVETAKFLAALRWGHFTYRIKSRIKFCHWIIVVLALSQKHFESKSVLVKTLFGAKSIICESRLELLNKKKKERKNPFYCTRCGNYVQLF